MRSHSNQTRKLFLPLPQRRHPKQKRNRRLRLGSQPNRTSKLRLHRRIQRNQIPNLLLPQRSQVKHNQNLRRPMRSHPTRWPVASLFRWLSF
jgi:hypothetical protein